MIELLKTPGFMTVLTMLINGVLFVVVLALKASWTPRKEHDALKGRVDVVETSMKSLVEKIDDMPDQRMMHQLTLQLTQLNGRLDVFDANVKGLGDDLKRLERHLNLLDQYQREAGKK